MKIFEREAAYEKLKFYQQICELRSLISKITERMIRNHPKLVSQMRDAARSVKQNIREGYRRGTLGEFRRGIKISQGSLEELSGDIEDCHEDGLVSDKEFQSLSKLVRSTDYLMMRYVQSLYKMEKEGTWKIPGKTQGISEAPSRFYATSRNSS